jgi:hypothetical protein
MGAFCQIFGHRFEQPPDAEAVRSSDGALMVHRWTCRVCQARAQTYEPMDAFIRRIGDWAERSSGSRVPPPAWLGPPRPERFAEGRAT